MPFGVYSQRNTHALTSGDKYSAWLATKHLVMFALHGHGTQRVLTQNDYFCASSLLCCEASLQILDTPSNAITKPAIVVLWLRKNLGQFSIKGAQ